MVKSQIFAAEISEVVQTLVLRSSGNGYGSVATMEWRKGFGVRKSRTEKTGVE